jgi:HEAT repeat protein
MRVLLNSRPIAQADTIDLVHALRFLSTRRTADLELARRDLGTDLPQIQQLFGQPAEDDDLLRICAARALWLANRSPEAAEYLIDQASHDDVFASQAAVEFLQPLGPAAAGAVPALIRRLEAADLYDPLVPIEAAEILGAIGPEASAAIPQLQQLMAGGDAIQRAAAVRAAARIAPATDVIWLLEPTSADPEAAVRQATFDGLSWHAADSPDAVRLMVNVCRFRGERRDGRDPGSLERTIHRLRAFGALGSAAATAEGYLLHEIQHGVSTPVKAEAVFALWQTTGTGLALPLMLDLLQGFPEDRSSIYRLLGEMGPSARHAIPDLVLAISNPADADRWAAVEAVVRLGPGWEAAIPAIRAQLRADHDRVVAAAAVALWETGDGQTVVPVLIAALNNRPSSGRADCQYLAQALGRIGSDASDATELLEEVIYDPNKEVAYAAAAALATIDPGTAAGHGITPSWLSTR